MPGATALFLRLALPAVGVLMPRHDTGPFNLHKSMVGCALATQRSPGFRTGRLGCYTAVPPVYLPCGSTHMGDTRGPLVTHTGPSRRPTRSHFSLKAR